MNRAHLLGALIALTAGLGGSAQAAELLTNGGFEDGYTAVGPSTVPNGWTPNAAYVGDGYAQVDTTYPRSGSYDLKIGNYDASPVDMLSQTFTDVVGGLYTVSFYSLASKTNDPNAFLTVSAGGQSFTFDDVADYGNYELGTFTFTGSGSDTLTIAAATDPGDWYVDDVSVNGAAVTPPAGGVPEPACWALMIVGFGMSGGLLRHRRRGGLRLA
ncbi:PEPxxWA-CTERM sorting domain-containing protein [Phenylobacterium sp.]|uniref:PEPxxWA-CTERM sorting domain-containing protein n=1 Tax=Phenylobacterium sp. TaxID=1871053 RepID=UPI00120EE5C3|nr:PEPxxWA-CTERM sorting domain-containing protein [Phenylobacterium sp.]THD59530.1 MAG: hypothetical protein E8A49_16220 [Phenylobacterium sp.]